MATLFLSSSSGSDESEVERFAGGRESVRFVWPSISRFHRLERVVGGLIFRGCV